MGEIRHYTSGGTTVIEAPAEFGIYTAPAVRELTIRLQREGTTAVVIDLSAVTFMDNTALGVIVGALRRFREAGGWLAVAGASQPVTRMFTTTNLAAIVPMYSAAGDAVSEESAGEDIAGLLEDAGIDVDEESALEDRLAALTGSTRYEVTGTRRGWFGPTEVRRTAAGKREAERTERQMRRSGLQDVRVRCAGSWFG